MPEEFSLSLTEVDAVAERAGLPRNWHPFEVPSVGTTLVDHERAVTTAWDSLRARGLARQDKLDLEVAEALETWTRPEVLIIVRAVEIEDNLKVFYRAAASGSVGVFSELAADDIRFLQLRADRLVNTVIGMLPPYVPVPLAPLTITRGGRPDAPEDFSAMASQRRANEKALAKFSTWPPHRHGTVELSVRTSGRLRPVGTVNFLDTDGGRFLTFTEQLPGGETRYRFVPSDGSHLRRWLHESITEARS
ncbi:ESX secretion-associated protein EspG [Amycolatopsis sp. H20-H5]|uniref:ESX secretion-associated protein EspG n=1 Tax=Amycolatopsis sp. H20-H5 TaxID=3046309 RepID=UPI002DB918B0|nr:ESX secretion-associated protein EspG [Amycolatopsis sp. H20-H5]MEC3978583.1 ESX secretion-associated protein EspG [Amycolatopsis sp. H20-H5]